MPRMTKEELDQLEALTARRQAEQEKDDASEITIRREGHEVVLKGADARRYRAKLGLDDDDEDEGDGGAGDGGGDPPARKSGYFKGKA